MIDFSTWKENTFRTYGGANGKKICAYHNDEPYMIKFFNPSVPNTKPMSAVSEYLGCHIYSLLDIPAQRTILGYYSTKNSDKYLAVACKDFCDANTRLNEFSMIRNAIICSSNEGSNKHLMPILLALEEQQFVSVEEIKERFWDMVVVDALIANFDRHTGNFGILSNEIEQWHKIAPVYDCGSSLYPALLTDKQLEDILSSKDEQLKRVYDFPMSTYREANGKKISYLDLLSSDNYPECLPSLQKIQAKINMDQIQDLINHIECISDVRKEFYYAMLSLRKELLLEYSLQKNLSINILKSSVEEFILETHRREYNLVITQQFDNLCQIKYAQIYTNLLNNELSDNRLHRNSNDDIIIAAILRESGLFHKDTILETISKLSPNAVGKNNYAGDIFAKARKVEYRDLDKQLIYSAVYISDDISKQEAWDKKFIIDLISKDKSANLIQAKKILENNSPMSKHLTSKNYARNLIVDILDSAKSQIRKVIQKDISKSYLH